MWVLVFALLAVAIGLAGVLAFVHSHDRRVRRGVAAALLLIGLVLALDFVAFTTDFRDADGVLDCSGSCSVLQQTIGWTAVIGIPLFAVLLIALLARVVVDRVR